MKNSDNFILAFNGIAQEVNQTAHDKGWYDMDEKLSREIGDPGLHVYVAKLQRATRIALIHSELSEGLEGDRKNLADDKIPQFTAMEAELADAVIRIMDFSVEQKLRVAEAVIVKAQFNKGREYLHGGKAF